MNLMEQIEQLAGRIESLMQVLDMEKERSRNLTEENAQLKDQLGRLGEVESETEQLRQRIGQLEEELGTRAEKDVQVRERLQGILGRIDQIVQTDGEASGQPAHEHQG